MIGEGEAFQRSSPDGDTVRRPSPLAWDHRDHHARSIQLEIRR